jgi:hypothetical protein
LRTFWGARLVQALSEEHVRAVVQTARLNDRQGGGVPDRNAARAPGEDPDSMAQWDQPGGRSVAQPVGRADVANAAVDAAEAPAAERCTVSWTVFDNASGTHRLVGDEQQVTDPRTQAPPEAIAGPHRFVSARIRAFHPDRPAWWSPLDAYSRRAADGWMLIGLERRP